MGVNSELVSLRFLWGHRLTLVCNAHFSPEQLLSKYSLVCFQGSVTASSSEEGSHL